MVSFSNMKNNQVVIQAKMNELELKGEEVPLNEEELVSWRTQQEEFWRIVMHKESLRHQKAKVKWLNEGDCTSKYFHLMVNWKRRNNLLRGLHMEGEWSQSPQRLRNKFTNLFL